MQVFQEKPLNMAHFCERQADQFLLNGDRKSAAQCYRDASCHIAKAMEASYSINCLPVLQMQYDFYVTQSLLKEKTIEQPKCDYESEEMDRLKHVDIPRNQLLSEDVSDGPSVKKESAVVHQLPSKSIYARMSALEREPDSLLQFLDNDRREEQESKCRKFPKADRDVIEELKVRNQHLQELVTTLMEEKGKLENENRSLKINVKDLESQLMNRSGNTVSKPLGSFTVPEFIHGGEFAQPQSFFHFDDPLTVYQLSKAMEEDADGTEIHLSSNNVSSKRVVSHRSSTNHDSPPSNCTSKGEETSSTIITSICYQEVDDA